MKKHHDNKTSGFTLAELLIVVAIIAVLVAISIPVFTNQLEKSREATDLANVRAAYAEVMVAANSGDTNSKLYDSVTGNYIATIPLKQKTDGWTTRKDDYQTVLEVGGCSYSDDASVSRMTKLPKSGGTCTVTYDTSTGLVVIDWGGEPNSSTPQKTYAIYEKDKYKAVVTEFQGSEKIGSMNFKLTEAGTSSDERYLAIKNDLDSEYGKDNYTLVVQPTYANNKPTGYMVTYTVGNQYTLQDVVDNSGIIKGVQAYRYTYDSNGTLLSVICCNKANITSNSTNTVAEFHNMTNPITLK